MKEQEEEEVFRDVLQRLDRVWTTEFQQSAS